MINVLLDYLLQRAYQVYGDNTCWGNTSIPIEIAIEAQSESCVALLLHWGTMRPEALFQTATYYGCLKTLQLLAKMYPQCVQESWNLKDKDYNCEIDDEIVPQRFMHKKRKYPPRLDMLCRAEIFQQLGYNPMPKAEQLSSSTKPHSLCSVQRYQRTT